MLEFDIEIIPFVGLMLIKVKGLSDPGVREFSKA
jgi:hypothetical protein